MKETILVFAFFWYFPPTRLPNSNQQSSYYILLMKLQAVYKHVHVHIPHICLTTRLQHVYLYLLH